jgi:hypothetical protein
MQKNRIWILAVAVMLVGASVVVSLSYTSVSNTITGSNSISNPNFTIFWVIPIPSPQIAGVPLSASFQVNNYYNAQFVDLVLVLNFTGTGVVSSCVTYSNCITGTFSIGTSSYPLAECAACGTVTSGSTPSPEFIMTGTIPNLPGGNTLVTLSLTFVHQGTFNQRVFLATSVPYP